jgi:hypothetical protein
MLRTVRVAHSACCAQCVLRAVRVACRGWRVDTKITSGGGESPEKIFRQPTFDCVQHALHETRIACNTYLIIETRTVFNTHCTRRALRTTRIMRNACRTQHALCAARAVRNTHCTEHELNAMCIARKPHRVQHASRATRTERNVQCTQHAMHATCNARNMHCPQHALHATCIARNMHCTQHALHVTRTARKHALCGNTHCTQHAHCVFPCHFRPEPRPRCHVAWASIFRIVRFLITIEIYLFSYRIVPNFSTAFPRPCPPRPRCRLASIRFRFFGLFPPDPPRPRRQMRREAVIGNSTQFRA